MSGGDLAPRISAMIRANLADPPGELHLRRLSGGTSQETSVIEAGDETYVLRRAPDAVPEAHPFAVGLPVEVGGIRAAAAHGVPTPKVLYPLEPSDGLGDGYVMRHIPGETLAPRLLRDAAFDSLRPTLTRACGAALARIHSVPVQGLPPLRTHTPATRLQHLHDSYAAQPDRRPVFELAFQWLTAHLPADPGLVHGGFRNGNLMIGPDCLRAVLDWELPHLGDGAEDLGSFHALVAPNALRIAQREIEQSARIDAGIVARLSPMLSRDAGAAELEQALAEEIAAGRITVLEEMAVDQPKYATDRTCLENAGQNGT